MDAAYKQHASSARRKNRSSTNLNHLTLAPLTSKLPIPDPDELPDLPIHHNLSYLQGKSAPATPRLLSRSPVHTRPSSPRRPSSVHGLDDANLPRSKSASHLHAAPGARPRGAVSGTATPHRRQGRQSQRHAPPGRSDSDWLLRAGALISTETREWKGQSWLASRQSNASLSGLRDAEEEAYEREVARERELASRRGSRRGSLVLAGLDEDVFLPSSRYGSRSHSRVGSISQLKTPGRTPLRTPMERNAPGGYFSQEHGQGEPEQSEFPGPDFVGLDEKLEAFETDNSQADEAAVRRLVKRDSAGAGNWMGSLLGWSLFSVEENEDESDDEDDMTDAENDEGAYRRLGRSASSRSLGGMATDDPRSPDGVEEATPPPKSDEGGWQDAAWLLSVASKVLL